MALAGPATAEVAQHDIDEARAFNTQLEALIASQPLVSTLPPSATRKARREGKGIFPAPVFLEDAKDIVIPGRGGPIKVRVIHPERPPTGVYLHIHGGGWTLGAHDMQDVALKSLADETGLCAASIDYRLAPENPYPAGPDDCEDAVLHLLEHGPSLLDAPPRFVIGGESAGAHLSVVTLLRLRDRHAIRGRIAAANLVFGAYDLNGTPSTVLWGDRNLVLSLPIVEWFTGNFLAGLSFEQRRAADISPLYARLEGMPPALFTVGTMDPLLDDTLFMSERWSAAGIKSELTVYPEAIHGFTAYPIGLAKAANARQYRFLRAALV
jgi:acetyl esterase/lipase